MLRRSSGVLITLLGLALAATPVLAQDEEVDPVTFTIDAGFASTSGNSDITTITAGQTFSWTKGHFVLSQGFDVLFNQTNDSTTAESYVGNIRGDRTFGTSERFSVFLDLRGSKNRFAGIDRRTEQALGVSWDAVKTAKDLVAIEGAATAVQQRGTNGVDRNFPAALAAARYVHTFKKDATFTVRGQYIPNLEDGNDYRMIGDAKLLAPITSTISLTVSYLIRYDNMPEPGFGKTDRFFTSGLQLQL
jgi:putative salt-induced outer membrane protein YdiY